MQFWDKAWIPVGMSRSFRFLSIQNYWHHQPEDHHAHGIPRMIGDNYSISIKVVIFKHFTPLQSSTDVFGSIHVLKEGENVQFP